MKQLVIYLLVSAGCGLFSFVYEHFSHQVYSNYMVYLFAISLLLGAVPAAISLLFPKLPVRSSWQAILQAFAVATLTAGSALQGMLEIYGTTSLYTRYYFAAGISLFIVSLVLWMFALKNLVSSQQ